MNRHKMIERRTTTRPTAGCRPSHRLLARALVGLLVLGPAAAGVAAAERRSGRQDEAARRAVDKQKEIARAMKEKAANDPSALQRQLDDLKAELQSEKDRHAATLEPLNKDLKAYTAAGDRKRASRTQKAIDKEKDSFKDRTEKLEKQIADLQARVDAAAAKPR